MSWDIHVNTVEVYQAHCSVGFKVDVSPGACEWVGHMHFSPGPAENEARWHVKEHEVGWEKYQKELENQHARR